MLVLLGPTFEGSNDEYARLAAATGLLAYDLRTKLRPGCWGVVKALGDPQQAAQLAEHLRAQGFRIAVVDPAIVQEPDRRVVPIRRLKLE